LGKRHQKRCPATHLLYALISTGLKDIIDHKRNGYLAKPFDVFDLASGINWVLSKENRHKELCIKAREKAVACFDIEKVAKQYESLYQEITA